MVEALVRFVHNPKHQKELPDDPPESEFRDVKITKQIQLSERQYDEFASNLGSNFDWLKGNRGETIEVLCTSTHRSLIVQTEGADYAKFVSMSY